MAKLCTIAMETQKGSIDNCFCFPPKSHEIHTCIDLGCFKVLKIAAVWKQQFQILKHPRPIHVWISWLLVGNRNNCQHSLFAFPWQWYTILPSRFWFFPIYFPLILNMISMYCHEIYLLHILDLIIKLCVFISFLYDLFHQATGKMVPRPV